MTDFSYRNNIYSSTHAYIWGRLCAWQLWNMARKNAVSSLYLEQSTSCTGFIWAFIVNTIKIQWLIIETVVNKMGNMLVLQSVRGRNISLWQTPTTQDHVQSSSVNKSWLVLEHLFCDLLACSDLGWILCSLFCT